MHIPSPGAVCPAMVTSPFFMSRFDVKAIVPDTVNTIILAPVWLSAFLKVPCCVPSAMVVTNNTFPPRPPVASLPKPSAPGKATAVSDTGLGVGSGGVGTSGVGGFGGSSAGDFFLQDENANVDIANPKISRFTFFIFKN